MRTFRRAAAAVLTVCLLLSGCVRDDTMRQRQFFAMDTLMSLSACGSQAETALDEAQEKITALDRLLSVTDPSSELARLNAGEYVSVSDETADLLAFALEMAARTHGAVDPTVYPAVHAWGFTADEYRVPDEEELAALLPLIDYRAVSLDGNSVTLPAGAMLDLGGFAKGWAGDRMLAAWRELGVESGILRLGGNIQTLGAKPDGTPWVVGIRDPWGDGLLGTLAVRDLAVVTSGSYERYFEQDGKSYCHIFDPATARPAESGLCSVTAVGKSGAECDALSTALFVMGVERAAQFWRDSDLNFDFIIADTDGVIFITEGLRGTFTPEDAREVRVIA